MVKVAFIGLGLRGREAVERWCHIDDTAVVALCDVSAERMAAAQDSLVANGRQRAEEWASYERLCAETDADLVYICTDWTTHADIACCALSHRHHVAVEVPAAMTLKDIRRMVSLSETTGKQCMMLENCCYDYFETATASMAREGLFGELLHAEGGYCHPLDDRWDVWRLRYNAVHRGDPYPTHGLGPVCRALGDDPIEWLVAMDSRPSAETVERFHALPGCEGEPFANGAQTTTLMRTRRGRTILLSHNVQTPQPYSRGYRLVGTRGYAAKYPVPELWIDGRRLDDEETRRAIDDHLPEYMRRLRSTAEQYDNRGGISWLMDYRLAWCLNHDEPLDMNVHDLAQWCAPVELTEQSINQGFKPVKFPPLI